MVAAEPTAGGFSNHDQFRNTALSRLQRFLPHLSIALKNLRKSSRKVKCRACCPCVFPYILRDMRPGLALLCASFVVMISPLAEERAAIRYNQSIRPLLSDNCFACHGPDAGQRKGKLRLDIREAALEKKAIVPGKPEESELVKRIFTQDADDLMPPAESHKVLTSDQKELLKEWIAQGAEYEGHWAYIAPVKPATAARRNGADPLVQQRLKSIGLKPSAQADQRTLIRRLYFDLVGLPPTPAEVEAFEKDTSPENYNQLVEKLLSTPEYGERMAIP